MAFAPADFIDADDVQRLPAAMLQPPEHHALDHGGDRLPVQAEVVGHGAPRQLAGQGRHRAGQGVRHALPLVGPRHAFDAQPAVRTPHAVGGVHQHDDMLAQGQIAPASLGPPGRGDPDRRAATLAAVQPAMLAPVEVDDEFLGGLILLDLDHGVGFQSQAFPDKRFHAHRSWVLPVSSVVARAG